MITDYGTDLANDWGSGFPDLGFDFESGRKNLAAALGRRLITPRGALFYDPNYGFDVRSYLNRVADEQAKFELATLTEAECEKDPRVLEATAVLTQSDLRNFRLTVNIVPLEGAKFSLVLEVSGVSAKLLEVI